MGVLSEIDAGFHTRRNDARVEAGGTICHVRVPAEPGATAAEKICSLAAGLFQLRVKEPDRVAKPSAGLRLFLPPINEVLPYRVRNTANLRRYVRDLRQVLSLWKKRGADRMQPRRRQRRRQAQS